MNEMNGMNGVNGMNGRGVKKRLGGRLGPKRNNVQIRIPGFKGPDPESFSTGKLEILAFDPGQTTGWSLLVVPRHIMNKDCLNWPLITILEHSIIWEHGELNALANEDECAYQMSKMVNSYPAAAIVVEDFILRAERKEKSRELLSPVRITAKLEAYMWQKHRKPFLQQPSQAKTVVSNERLKAWDCLMEDGVTDHARDADRHAILFLRRCLGPQGVSLKRVAWPHIYGVLEDETDIRPVHEFRKGVKGVDQAKIHVGTAVALLQAHMEACR